MLTKLALWWCKHYSLVIRTCYVRGCGDENKLNTSIFRIRKTVSNNFHSLPVKAADCFLCSCDTLRQSLNFLTGCKISITDKSNSRTTTREWTTLRCHV